MQTEATVEPETSTDFKTSVKVVSIMNQHSNVFHTSLITNPACGYACTLLPTHSTMYSPYL